MATRPFVQNLIQGNTMETIKTLFLALLVNFAANLPLTDSYSLKKWCGKRFLVMLRHGPLTRCVKMWVAHALGMSGTFSPPQRVSDPDMHHGMCVAHVPWCMPGSLTSGFIWSRCREKCSRYSRHMRNPQFYVSDKRPMKQCQRNIKQTCYEWSWI